MPDAKPTGLRIRAYDVGFGDAFLLTFTYPKKAQAREQKRHVLIDFGSTGLPEGTPADQMVRVAQDIRTECGGVNGKLHVVVATHRHKDHISGFATDGDATGKIISALKPEVVIQPWTEDPKVSRNATGLRPAAAARSSVAGQSQSAFVGQLGDMHAVAAAVSAEVDHLNDRRKFAQGLTPGLTEQLQFLSVDNNLPNASAVDNLAGMGKQTHYVNHGYKLDLQNVLPGVKVRVLGPPTIEQYANVKKERASDKDEFWMLQAAAAGFWGLQASTGELVHDFILGKTRLFPQAEFYKDSIPAHNRWFVRRVRSTRGNQLLGIVRILDKAMNNTSVILLFEVGDKKFLFPGDAQIENWEYALSNQDDVEALRDVCLYKVGHHGSRNATPKTLWGLFQNKKDATEAGGPGRLSSIVSTMADKHGHEASNTEVPRKTLVSALKKYSNYNTTQTAAKEGKLYVDLTIPL